MEIAILVTTFNRKEKTLASMECLQKQILPDGVHYTVYMLDDNSKDGTADAVKKNFPDVRVSHGSGSLYWVGGMREIWREALKKDYDFYLMINDDTFFMDDMIVKLLDTYQKALEKYNQPAICIGSTKDIKTSKITYGGRILVNKKKVNKMYLVEGNESMAECDLANANIMFVPRGVVEKIGIFCEVYSQAIADYDYTLTARKNGIPVMVAPGVLGVCENDHPNAWKSQKTKLKDRIAYLHSPKGLYYKEYLYFIKTHFPSHYPAVFMKLWMKTLFPVLWDKFKKA